jgi:hypothetical protein
MFRRISPAIFVKVAVFGGTSTLALVDAGLVGSANFSTITRLVDWSFLRARFSSRTRAYKRRSLDDLR